MSEINKICQTSIIGLVFALGFVTNSFAAINCPILPTTNLGTVNYAPNSVNNTIVDFTATIPASNSGITGFRKRQIYIYKQKNEDEGLDYSITAIVGGNLNNRASGQINSIYGGYSWRSGPYDYSFNYGYITTNADGTASFRLNIRKGQTNLTSKDIEFIIEGYWDDLQPYYGINTSSCTGLNNGYKIGPSTFHLNVPTSTAISMAGGGTSGDIKFDTGNGLKTGEKNSITINVKSNQKYKVSFDSAYNGYLNLNNALGATEKVPYTMTFAGQPVSDSAAFEDTTATGTGGSYAPKTLEVTIGNTDNARAGWYKDVVTLTITSPY